MRIAAEEVGSPGMQVLRHKVIALNSRLYSFPEFLRCLILEEDHHEPVHQEESRSGGA